MVRRLWDCPSDDPLSLRPLSQGEPQSKPAANFYFFFYYI